MFEQLQPTAGPPQPSIFFMSFFPHFQSFQTDAAHRPLCEDISDAEMLSSLQAVPWSPFAPAPRCPDLLVSQCRTNPDGGNQTVSLMFSPRLQHR